MEKLSPSIVARYICENALAVTTTPNSLPISRDSKNPGSPPPKRIAALYLPVSQASLTQPILAVAACANSSLVSTDQFP